MRFEVIEVVRRLIGNRIPESAWLEQKSEEPLAGTRLVGGS
jgi:hypothetical protein